MKKLWLNDFKRIGDKPGGTVPGWLAEHRDDGSRWIIKFVREDILAQNEVLAAKLYEHAGVRVPELHLVEYEGHNAQMRLAVASRYDDNLYRPEFLDGNVLGLMEGFLVDCWLANWDVIGLEYDNIMKDDFGAVRVDVGGSLLFRAQGAPKGKQFGPAVLEVMSMLDYDVNPQAYNVFKRMEQHHILSATTHIDAIDPAVVIDLVDECGLPEHVTKVILDRLDFIKERFKIIPMEDLDAPSVH